MERFDDYQEAAIRTAHGHPTELHARAYFALGLVGEAGEVAEMVKKSIRKGLPVDPLKLREELGDVLWYIAALADHYGIELETVAAENISKLKKRYPTGYTVEDDIKRRDVG